MTPISDTSMDRATELDRTVSTRRTKLDLKQARFEAETASFAAVPVGWSSARDFL